ncbi:MAG: hypothetical protein GX652_16595 [Burkholderiaceae bacterium]|nr:hypothetical protein [Burkholderiaceae bacterium]
MDTNAGKDAAASDTAKLTPPRLSEVVLKTSRYGEMKAWYETVLGVKAHFEHTPPDWERRRANLTERLPLELKLCFIRVAHAYPYSQVLALFDYPDLREPEGTSGLHHLQFRNADLLELLRRYEGLRERGIRPYKSFNHGPATAFYFDDPDGNLVELSAANFPTEAEYLAFMKSPQFAANPVGVAVDPDELIDRMHAGEAVDQLARIG